MSHGTATDLPSVDRDPRRGTGIELEATRDADRWTAAAHASGLPVTPFHTRSWLDLAARMTGTTLTPLVVRAGGRDVGVVPWLSRARGPVVTVNWLPFPYVGPLVAAAHLPGVLRAVRRLAARRRAVVAQFGFTPLARVRSDDVDGSGFRVLEDATYVVDTSQDVDRLWASLEGRARTKVRKAERGGVVVTTPEAPEEVLRRVVDAAFAARGLTSGYTGTSRPGPPTCWVLLARPADGRAEVSVPPPAVWRQGARRLAPEVLAVGVFAAVVAWAASWQERPDSGPYAQLGYAGALADVTGPVDVAPGEPVPLPVQLERSDGQPWSGLVTVSVDGQAQDTQTVRVAAGDVVPLQATAPTGPGLHDATVNAVSDDTGEELSLTLRLQVGGP